MMILKIFIMKNSMTIDEVTQAIKRNLTTDLLSSTWISKNGRQRMAGHCYHASAVLKKYFPELKLYRSVDDEGEYHWWCQKEVDGHQVIIDITSEQYTDLGRPLPYKGGQKESELGFSYREKVQKLLDRVENDLNGTNATLNEFLSD